MKTIAIQDANILIDLVNTGLFDHCLVLEYRFTTTNIILDELHQHQIALIQPHISSGKFTVIDIDEEGLIEIQVAAVENNRISEQDWSAIYYAQKYEAFLLTGDKRLRSLAQSKGVRVCGIFWILDQLVEIECISKQQACEFIKDLNLKNKRLPGEEYNKRIRNWCDN